jgi:hypothetical protein
VDVSYICLGHEHYSVCATCATATVLIYQWVLSALRGYPSTCIIMKDVLVLVPLALKTEVACDDLR